MNPVDTSSSSSARSVQSSTTRDWRSTVPCRYFQQKRCWGGKSCSFLHEHALLEVQDAVSQENEETKKSSSDTRPTSSQDTRPICKFFREGCWYGDECRYRHEDGEDVEGEDEDEGAVSNSKKAAAEEPNRPADPEDKLFRMFDSALVEFDAGTGVAKVRFQCDFSTVRIGGFPKSTTKQLVRDMLEEVGFGDCVEEVHMTEVERSCEATVIADSPSFAKQFCERIVPGFTWRGMSIRAWQVGGLVPRAFKDRQVDRRKVTVSWPRPGKEAVLSYGNSSIAEKVCSLFNGGYSLILGQRVVAELATAAGPSRLAFKVTLTGLPLGARDSDVRCTLKNSLTPRLVKVGGYVASAGTTFSAVHSLLAAIGPLETFDVIDDPAEKQLKVVASFLSQSDSLRAAKELDKTAPSFYPGGQLSVRDVYTVRFAVDKRVYDVMSEKLVVVTSEQSVFNFGCRSVDTAIKVFTIEGESVSHVAEAKKKIESILSGIVVEEDGAALWHPTLQADGLLCEKIADLEEQLGVVIARDPVRCNLCVFGSDEACTEARGKLVELVHRESGTDVSRSIPLEDPNCYWGTNAGFQKLAEAFGPGKMWLNLAFPSKAIEMKGTLEDYDQARAVIVGNAHLAEDPAASEGTPRSFVCYHPSKHVDVTMMCRSRLEALSVADLCKHLPAVTLERELKGRFSEHIEAGPDQFRSCPTPDCGYIYRIRGTECPEWHVCSNCLKTTCTVCHSQHLGT